MLRASDIGDGRIQTAELVLISHDVDKANPRTRLRPGDVVIVLVGRIGEAACVTSEHEGWQAARSLAVVRCADPALAEWLRVWLASPTARAWCLTHATGSAQATLGVTKLRKLPVPLPSADVRDRTLHAVKVIEARIAVNERIARTAVALADAHFAAAAFDRSTWLQCRFEDIANAWTGSSTKPAEPLAEGKGTAWAAPADVLHSPLPYLDRTAERVGGDPAVHPPNTLLVAPKAGEVRAAINQVPMAVGRGVLAVQPSNVADIWWLLHEIRSRSGELSTLGQGTRARELSARALLQAAVSLPPIDTMRRFAHLASTLHARALTAARESRTLRPLLTASLPLEVPTTPTLARLGATRR
ncbi:hypothetical protein ACFC0M_06605 [Streptomyces sp. NPDC056149]|uniref:hypothetical protein n=1 Tax=Streptomyces sp. NPDC056149 TaxID=3345728 RepID=UPI0035D80669